MKVLLVNGSSHAKGTTYTALSEMVKVFEEEGIEAEIFQLGAQAIADCLGCNYCGANGECIIDDNVNAFVKKAKEADAFVFGSPVYYAHPSGRICDFLDRVFYSSSREVFQFKPGAAVAVARRGGCSATLDALNKYFGIAGMPVAGSTYWNMAHGRNGDDVVKDEEGMQTMRNLARNMAWMMRCFEAGKAAGVALPEIETGNRTNFIR